MQIEVSVKKPLRGLRSPRPASVAGSVGPLNWPISSRLFARLVDDLPDSVADAFIVRLDRGTRAGLVLRDQAQHVLALRPAARLDIAGPGLRLLDCTFGSG